MHANELHYGNRFWWGDGKLYQHCGWVTAVPHVAGFCLSTGEKRTISFHSEVTLFEDFYWDGAGI